MAAGDQLSELDASVIGGIFGSTAQRLPQASDVLILLHHLAQQRVLLVGRPQLELGLAVELRQLGHQIVTVGLEQFAG